MTTDTAASGTATPQPSGASPDEQRFVWARTYRTGLPDGALLAALRRGVGREPGTVPQMWEHYTKLQSDGDITAELRAEHATLTLFSIHQQSQPRLVHAPGIRLGTAMKALHDSGKFSPDAVDRRFATAATATSLSEASYHLRGLVRQLRPIQQPVDYTALYRDLVNWQDPDDIGRVRREWASQYFWDRGKKRSSPASEHRS